MFFSNSDGGELKLYFVAEVRLGIMSRGEVGLTPEGLHSFAPVFYVRTKLGGASIHSVLLS